MAFSYRRILSALGIQPPPTEEHRGSTRLHTTQPNGTAKTARENQDNVTFHFPASEELSGLSASSEMLKAIRAFAPSQPVPDVAHIAGRAYLLKQLVSAIEETRNHVIIYGGRGTGKTSIAMGLLSIAREAGYHCTYLSCSHDSSIDSIARTTLANLPIRFDSRFDPRTDNANAAATFSHLLPEGLIALHSFLEILSRVIGTRMLIVIDEFDRSENEELSRDLAELMKILSDRAIPLQIVIIGVGYICDNIIGQHASIARMLYTIQIKLMSAEEINETLLICASHAGVAISPDVISECVSLAQGRPYIARLIGLKAAKFALNRGSKIVEYCDFEFGMQDVVEYLGASGFERMKSLVLRFPDNIMIFKAIISCERDAADWFTISDIISVIGVNISIPIQDTLDLLASDECNFLFVDKEPVVKYRFADTRVELCMSILCNQVKARDLSRALHKPETPNT